MPVHNPPHPGEVLNEALDETPSKLATIEK